MVVMLIFISGGTVLAVLYPGASGSIGHPTASATHSVDDGRVVEFTLTRTAGEISTERLEVVVTAERGQATAHGFPGEVTVTESDSRLPLLDRETPVSGALVDRDAVRSGDEFSVHISESHASTRQPVEVYLVHESGSSRSVIVSVRITSLSGD